MNVPSYAQRRLCFVIGPMGGGRMGRLRRLAHDIIGPLIEPHGFDVETPDHSDVGRIMDQVLLSLDQADLLVADLTGNNPNVLYELAIYHTAGRPYVTVRDTAAEEKAEQTPFDIQAYRYVDIDFDDVEGARGTLGPTIQALFESPDNRNWYSNPITDFYQSPVTHLRYASALAENYLRNFLRKVIDAVFEDNGEIVVNGVPVPSGHSTCIEVILPEDFNQARHRYVEQRLLRPGHLVGASVTGRSRPFSLYARPGGSSTCRLVDIPTILATIRESVEQRMGPKARQGRVSRKERARLERAEGRRFREELTAELEMLIEERLYRSGQIRIIEGNPFED
jgi:hypothetical protein